MEISAGQWSKTHRQVGQGMVPGKRCQCPGVAKSEPRPEPNREFVGWAKETSDGKEAVQYQEPGDKGGMGQDPCRDMQKPREQVQEPFGGYDQEQGLCHWLSKLFLTELKLKARVWIILSMLFFINCSVKYPKNIVFLEMSSVMLLSTFCYILMPL